MLFYPGGITKEYLITIYAPMILISQIQGQLNGYINIIYQYMIPSLTIIYTYQIIFKYICTFQIDLTQSYDV